MHTRLFALAGFLSGLIFAASFTDYAEPLLTQLPEDVQAQYVRLGPGIFFAVGIGVLLLLKLKWPAQNILLFAIASIAGSFVSVFFAMEIFTYLRLSIPEQALMAAVGVAGGLVGSALFSLIMVRLLKPHKIPLVVATGAVLGAVLAVWLEPGGVFIFFAVWQAGFAVALSRALESNAEPVAAPV